jgi:hypothetical protein
MDPHFLVLGTSWRWMVSFTPRSLYPRGNSPPGTHWIGGWVGPTTCLGDVKRRKFLILPELELRPLGPPARSQSLHRLRYPGSLYPLGRRINYPGVGVFLRNIGDDLWLYGFTSHKTTIFIVSRSENLKSRSSLITWIKISLNVCVMFRFVLAAF